MRLKMNIDPIIIGNKEEYKVLEEIDKGGMGIVYRVVGQQSNLPFAAKVLSDHRFDIGEKERKRFMKEAKIGMTFDHPNVVRTIELIDNLEYPILIMEFIPGPSLYKMLKLQNGKPFDMDKSLSFMRQLAEGLSYLHQKMVVHRDLTPKNVLFRSQDILAISDFGLSRHPEDETLTEEGVKMGSLLYISPQQFLDSHDASFCDDVFSLGQVFFHVVTGLVPHGPILPAAYYNQACPAEINRLILRMRNYNSNERPQNGNEVLSILEIAKVSLQRLKPREIPQVILVNAPVELASVIVEYERYIEANSYHEAVSTFLGKIGTQLYKSGAHETVIGLLNKLLQEDEFGLHSLNEFTQAEVLHRLARAYKSFGNPILSASFFERELNLRKRCGEYKRVAITLRLLSSIKLLSLEFSVAEKYLSEGINLSNKIAESGIEAGLHRQLGILFTYEGRFDEAREELSHLPEKFRSARHSDIAPLSDLCLHAILTKNWVQALFLSRDMHRLAYKYKNPSEIAHSEMLLGTSLLFGDDLPRAEVHLNKGLQLCRDIKFIEIEPDLLLAIALLQQRKGNMDSAKEYGKKALSIANYHAYTLKQTDIYNFLARIEYDFGNKEDSLMYAKRAHKLARNGNGTPHFYKLAFIEAERIFTRFGSQ